MSHKKGNSKVHVPFSWEKMPGVPKFMASPICALVPRRNANNHEVHPKLALPLPPGSFRKPVRSVSKRVLVCAEDPFLVAMIKCTKDCDINDSKTEEIKTFGNKVCKSKYFFFSCKRSFDIEECHLSMRPSSLGSILLRERLENLKH